MPQKCLREEWRELEPWASWGMRVGPLGDMGVSVCLVQDRKSLAGN